MTELSLIKSLVASIDVSTRGKRRKTVLLVIDILEKIRTAEESYMQRIPLNLQEGDAYAAADYSVDIIIDAIAALSEAY